VLRPTPGELLAITRRELTEQVLPELPAGAASRQLRAALHVLAQLERSWDLMPSYLATDNADLRSSLAALERLTGISAPARPGIAAEVPGVQDEALRGLIRDNDALQADLDDVQQAWRATGRSDETVDTLLLDLHVRMADRARLAAGLAEA
jgi:hypothetical protein